MENARKYLKIHSIVILVLTLSSILSIASGIIGLKNAEIPEGAPSNILQITRIFLIVLAALLLLPQIYVGIKGLKVAKNPDSSKAHIVVAIILFIFTVIDAVSPLTAIIKQNAFGENIAYLLTLIVEAWVYFDYIKYARLVAKGN